MAMVSCLYIKIVSILGWYVEIGALIRVTYDRSLLNMFQEKEGGMCADLGYDANYHVWVMFYLFLVWIRFFLENIIYEICIV